MKKLKEIIELLNMDKLKAIEIIDNNIDSNTKLMQLYKGIKTKKLTTDKEAKATLYPNTKDNNAYYKLKHTLRERLFNTIFFVDIKSNKYSDIHKAKLSVQKYSCLLKILLTKGLKVNSVDIAQKGLKLAQTFEFTEEKLIFARALRSHTAIILGDQNRFEEYDKIINECTELLRSEIKVEGLFFKTLSLYVNDKSTKPYVHERTKKYLRELENYQPSQPSANWIYHHTMIKIFMYMSINKYQKALSLCKDSIKEIHSFPFQHTKSIVNISSQMISCCIQLRQYEEGEKSILTGLEIMQPGIFNWFKYKELHMTLCFHTKRYSKAWEIFNKVTSLKKFNGLQDNVKEIWKIYKAWLYFFINSGKIVLEKNSQHQKFKVSRYANEVPIFFKDKRGLNVPILISQIVLLLQQKKHNTVLDRVEAIKRYKSRYLHDEYNFRSNIFISMLLIVSEEAFDRKTIIDKTLKERELLDKVPIDIANQSADIEILPYEDTWNILLEQLE